jgi:hypothetical protein
VTVDVDVCCEADEMAHPTGRMADVRFVIDEGVRKFPRAPDLEM